MTCCDTSPGEAYSAGSLGPEPCMKRWFKFGYVFMVTVAVFLKAFQVKVDHVHLVIAFALEDKQRFRDRLRVRQYHCCEGRANSLRARQK